MKRRRFALPASLRKLLHNASWLLGAQLGGLGLQILTWLLLARTLGASEFGHFAAAAAWVALLAPLATLGYDVVLLRRAARAPEQLGAMLQRALWVSAAAGTVLSVLAVAVAAAWPRVLNPELVVWLAAADLLAGRPLALAGSALQVADRYRTITVLNLLQVVLRLSAAALFALGPAQTALHWAHWYFAVAVLAALGAAVLGLSPHRGVRGSWRGLESELREGLLVMVGGASRMVVLRAAQVLLAGQVAPTLVGSYAVANRVIEWVVQPMQSLTLAAMPGLARAGARGLPATLPALAQLFGLVLPFGLFAAAGCVAAGKLIPLLLGPVYAEVPTMLGWLAVLPMLRGMQMALGQAFGSSGHQGLRTALQLFTALLCGALCILGITLAGWRGAAAAILCTEAVLVTGFALSLPVVILRRRRGKDADAHAPRNAERQRS